MVLHCEAVGRRLVIAAIIALALGAPVAEMIDRWDNTPADGNDTEANVVITALCVGAAFAIGTVAVTRMIRALSTSTIAGVTAQPEARLALASVVSPEPASSPPTVLRV